MLFFESNQLIDLFLFRKISNKYELNQKFTK